MTSCPVTRSTTQARCRAVRFIFRSVGRSVGRFVLWSVNQSFGRSFIRPFIRLVGPPLTAVRKPLIWSFAIPSCSSKLTCVTETCPSSLTATHYNVLYSYADDPLPLLFIPPTQEVVSALISIGLAVRNLSLASNDIGDAGARALARLLDDKPPVYRCALASLNLRGNSIGSEGCQVCSLLAGGTFGARNVIVIG